MLDIKAIKLKGFTRIRKVDYLSEAEVLATNPADVQNLPYILRIEGDNFNKATDVVINGVETIYSVLSSTVILATLPASLEGRPLQSIYVLTDKENFAISSIYSYELGDRPEMLTGAGKAVAQFIKVLMTTPGTDMFDKGLGGGLQKFPGSKTQGTHVILARAAMAVQKAADQIRARNANLKIPPEENLQSIEILAIDFIKGDPTSVEVRLRVNTLADTGLPVSLQLGAQSLVQDLLRDDDGAGTT